MYAFVFQKGMNFLFPAYKWRKSVILLPFAMK